MTKFDFCIAYVLKNEGGYSDHPNDRGGCTNHGITLATARRARDLGINTCEDLKAMTTQAAKQIYYRFYWKFGEINDWRVAAKMFDIFVNLRPVSANKIFQRAANVCGAPVAVDGFFGPKTVIAINSCNPVHYLEELIDQLHTHYTKIVNNDPTQAVFLLGWLRRADRLPPEPTKE